MFEPLTDATLPEVLAIEPRCYSHPWTAGQFADSLRAGHWAMLRRAQAGGPVVAYAVAMAGVDEWHLLNLSTAPGERQRGHARALLAHLAAHLRTGTPPPQWLWLEVRASNTAAQALYARWGFEVVGQRPRYYPVDARQREDALVMRWAVA